MATAKFKIESGVQLLARLRRETNIDSFFPVLFESGLKSGDFVEVTLDSASYLLLDIVTEALIHTRTSGASIGVLIFNTDGHLNYSELLLVLKKKLSDSSSKNNDIESKLKETMSNLHILDIYDANQFISSIHNIDTILTAHPNISVIIFHSLTAFYWSEQGYKITKMDYYIKNLIDTIQKVIKEYKTICIYTKPEYFSSNNKDTDLIPMEVDYHIQSLDLGKGNYQVNVKTSKKTTTRFYTIINNKLQWSTS